MWTLLAFLFATSAVGTYAETAFINIVRHGEKCDGSGDDLTDVGYARAHYLSECMSSDSASAAMPLGKATAVMAGQGKHSQRPKETATPLAKKLGLDLHMPCSKTEADCFGENAVKYLTANGTLVVAWAHESIPPLIQQMNIPNLPAEYQDWPDSCESAAFKEPSCVHQNGDSVCYDIIWQIKMTRSNGESSWRAQSIKTLHEGFGGSSSSPCAQDLATKAIETIHI